jgi:hypothetical protein
VEKLTKAASSPSGASQYAGAGTSFFGCTYGEHTNLDNGWTRVVFKGNEPGAGPFGASINGVDVVMDEQGQTLLRNITVNGVTVDKFASFAS